MGNEQSSGGHGSTEGSQSGLLKDCVIDADPILNDQHWSLHHAQLHSTPMSVFISKDKNGSLDELAKNLRLYRHPHILRYINCTQCPKRGKTHLFTEKASPLSVVLKQQSSSQVCLGLQKLAVVLDFLKNVAKVSPDTISTASIFVTPEGNWKLSFQATSSSKPPPSEDNYDKNVADYGALIHTLLQRELSDELDGSADLLEIAKSKMQSKNPQIQPSFRQILRSSFFAHSVFVQIENFLSDLPMKSAAEREKFFAKELVPSLKHEIPANLVAWQLAPLLLSRMVLLDKAAVEHFLPHMLTPKDDLTHHDLTEKEEAILPAELFREKIIPILINIFHVREMQIRLVLLNFFPNYVGMFSKTQLEDVILPLVLLGIRDSNDNLVGETLKALSVLVSVLGAEKVVGKRKKVFADGSPAKSKIDGFSVKSKPCDTVEIAEQLPASPLPPKSDVAAKFFSSNSSSSIKEVEVPDENVRQSPIGAETSDEELHATLVGDDDWEPWEEDEELCASPNRPYTPELSENISSLKMMGPAETEEIDSLISVSACNTAAVKSKETLVKNPISVAEELDFFADMQPVIQTNQQMMTPHDKFAPILQVDNCEGDDQDGWNDVDDDAWS